MLNKVGHIIEPILGDNRTVLPENTADRVIMGYLKTEHSHRLAALKAIKTKGGIIHFHDVGFSNDCVESAFEKMQSSLYSPEFKSKFKLDLYDHYKIKSYGPKLTHVVLDIKVIPIL